MRFLIKAVLRKAHICAIMIYARGKLDAREFNRQIKKIAKDKGAFVRLYRFYYPRIVAFIRKEFPNADAEAVGQEFFIKVANTPPTKKIEYPASWVYAVSANLARDMTERAVKGTYYKEICVSRSNYLFEDMEEKAEISDRAQRVLEDVDEITRKILVLHYWSGYSFKEIAVIIGMKDAAVRKRHSRAIKKIQTLKIISLKIILVMIYKQIDIEFLLFRSFLDLSQKLLFMKEAVHITMKNRRLFLILSNRLHFKAGNIIP